jgi:hypothetical protein
MKKSFKFLTLIAIFIFVTNKASAYQPPKWQPLFELRELMKSSFHPMLKEDFAPARKNAALMLTKTTELVSSEEIPKEFRSKVKKAELQDLLTKAEIFAEKVKNNASDEEVKIALSEFHGVFAGLVPEKLKSEFQKNESTECNH